MAETKGIYRMVAIGMLWYPSLAVLEDRATLGSDPSAKTGPNGMGGKPLVSKGLSPFCVMLVLWPQNPVGLGVVSNPRDRVPALSSGAYLFEDK